MNIEEVARAYPELGSRPYLLKALGADGELRRDVMRMIHNIFAISGVTHTWVASYALHHYTCDVKEMRARWRDRLEGQHLVNNELAAAMNNILANARRRIGMPPRFIGDPINPVKAQGFVRREWGEAV